MVLPVVASHTGRTVSHFFCMMSHCSRLRCSRVAHALIGSSVTGSLLHHLLICYVFVCVNGHSIQCCMMVEYPALTQGGVNPALTEGLVNPMGVR